MPHRPGQIRVIFGNLALDGHGNKTTWTSYYNLLRSHDPHLVGRAEVKGADHNGEALLLAAEEALTPPGKPWLRPKGFLGAGATGGLRTAVFVRTDVFRPVRRGDHGQPWGCPPTSVDLRLVPYNGDPDCLREMCFAAAHHHYASPPARQTETQELTKFADRRDPCDRTPRFPNGRPREALLVMDANSYPEPGTPGDVPLPQPRQIEDKTHVRHRFTETAPGRLVPDTYSDRALRDVGLQDIARHLALTTGRTDVLAPTTPGYADQGGQLRACRIDRAYASAGVLDAVEDLTLIDCTGLSPHHALLITISRRKLAETLSRTHHT
ncbi:hypothetical protein ACWF94_00010 [Streptomyces sp. NPDC055078]